MEQKNAPSRDYLHTCRDLHARVTEIRYGRAQDLTRIEKVVARVRSSRRLTYDDIERIRDSRIWDADAFGYWPPRTEIESILQSTGWDFWNLPKREEKAISSLLQAFRQIEPVSVILRFIRPEHYGIMSPPVENVLGLGPFRCHADKFLAYLRNLRQIRDDRNFKTTADVDMALWVLQVGVLDEKLTDHDEYKALQDGFRQDSKLREIRVGNLTRQLFEDMSRAELAEALLATDVDLAGQIAGIEFEQAVKKLARSRSGTKLKVLVDEELPDLIDMIHQNGQMKTQIFTNCRKAVKTRNKAIHLDPPPSKEEVERLIETMSEIWRMERMQYE